jgi:hypothetical protein
MRRWRWVILLLSLSPLFAGERKISGYVMDAAAFRRIQSYCVDTHNLPPDQAAVIAHFVLQESEGRGMLTKLPWRRLASCAEHPDAMVRVEFPYPGPWTVRSPNDVEGVLFVFRDGSPSPIYETRPLLMPGGPGYRVDGSTLRWLRQSVVACVVGALIHDWQGFSAASPWARF